MAAVKSEPKEKTPRTVVISGIEYPVTRTYYDVSKDLVVDVYKKTKTVSVRGGGFKDVDLFIHTRCQDADLQTKYRRGDEKIVEVNIDV